MCFRLASDEIDFTPECVHDRARALSNVKQNKSSIWIFHITHHAGTYLRITAEDNGWYNAIPPGSAPHPCSLKEEELQDHMFYYDGVCGEYGMGGVANLAESFPCSSDKFVMITSMRHPILRILAGGGGYPENPNTDDCGTDNYGLRKLIGKNFGEPITQADVELAKARLSAFDIVLDVENMRSAIPAMCDMLGWTKNCNSEWGHHQDADQTHAAKLVAFQQEHPDLYQKWLKRNAPEMEVYEHAKHLWSQQFAAWQGKPHSSNSSRMLEGMPKGLEALYDAAEKASWICPGNATNGFA